MSSIEYTMRFGMVWCGTLYGTRKRNWSVLLDDIKREPKTVRRPLGRVQSQRLGGHGVYGMVRYGTIPYHTSHPTLLHTTQII